MKPLPTKAEVITQLENALHALRSDFPDHPHVPVIAALTIVAGAHRMLRRMYGPARDGYLEKLGVAVSP